MILTLGLVVIAVAVWAVIKNVDVRLTLITAALALGLLAGAPANIVRKFFQTLAAEEFLIPICAAMGFAHVLRHTQCDRHLVRVLTDPLRRVRVLLIPGAVLVGFVVNIPIISQTSTAVAVGSVLIPLLLAAGVSPVTAGSVLLLGASIGGELLNQGAPEFRTVVRETTALGVPLTGSQCVQAVFPLVALHLVVSTIALWILSVRRDAQTKAVAPPPVEADTFQVSHVKAMVPLVPLILLFVVAPPLKLVEIPTGWLVGPQEASSVLGATAAALGNPRLADAAPNPFDSRLVGLAMVVGAIVAALASRGTRGTVGAFFEGTGFALTHIISIIVAAACFGEGVKLLGLHRMMGDVLALVPHLLVPVASVFPLAFAAISGSGMAATQSLFGLFAGPSVSLGVAPEHVGAVVALAAAAGRTMSPVAAVTLMCASLTATRPSDLVRRVAGPLFGGIVVTALVASVMVATGQRTAARPVPAASAPAGVQGAMSSARAPQPTPDVTLGIVTGPEGGVYHPLGQALARILSARLPGVHAQAQATPGSVFNVDAVERGVADIAFAQGDAAYSAFRQGTPQRPRPHTTLRAVAVLYTNVMQIVVRRGDELRGVGDLRGRRVGMGPTGSNTEITARIVLEANGLAASDLRAQSLGFDEATSHLVANELDADFVMASYPAAAIARANDAVGVRLLPIEGAPVRWIRERYPFYRPTVIPRETYRGQTGDVHTVGVDNVLVCRAGLPEELVQRITGLLLSSIAELSQVHAAARGIDPEQAPAAMIPLHPGAARFYRERELLR